MEVEELAHGAGFQIVNSALIKRLRWNKSSQPKYRHCANNHCQFLVNKKNELLIVKKCILYDYALTSFITEIEITSIRFDGGYS